MCAARQLPDVAPALTLLALLQCDHAASAARVQDSDDIRFMCGALKELGIKLDEDWANSKLTVHGCAGRFPVAGAQLSLGNAGTAMRPLTAAVAAAGRGEFILDGVARMRERPIQDLVDGLVQLGACVYQGIPYMVYYTHLHVGSAHLPAAHSAGSRRRLCARLGAALRPAARARCTRSVACAGVDAECTMGTGCPPVRVQADGLKGGKISISGAVSSQYLTALLMAAPLAESDEVRARTCVPYDPLLRLRNAVL